MSEEQKFWELCHPGAIRGIVHAEPQMREQDAVAEPTEGYCIVFFPKITDIGPATMAWPTAMETLSRTPQAAIVKFMDRIKSGEVWDTYHDGGHRVRKVRITDLGDA